MKIFINAYTLRVAGGLSVGQNFLNFIFQNNDEDQFFVIVPPKCGYEKFSKKNITIVPIKSWLLNPLFKFFVNTFWLPYQIQKYNCEVVFSMGNIAIPTKRKQLLLFHLPHAAYPDKKYWGKKLSVYEKAYNILLVKTIETTIKYATIIAPQTETMKMRLANIYKIPIHKFSVIPNAVSFSNFLGNSECAIFKKDENFKYLLMLSKYYPHKNFEAIISTGKLIKQFGLKFKIIITISEQQGKGAIRILNEILKHQLDEVIINVGPLQSDNLPSLYKECDGVLMPTLLESFSGTYIEAMHHAKPIFTSNLDFAKEICKEAAFYFDPFSPEDIINTIKDGFSNSELLNRKVSKGKMIVEQFSDWNTIGEKYIKLLKTLKN